MTYRVVWLSGMVLGGAAVAGACNAPDPGEVTFAERSHTESSTSSGGSSSGSTTSSSGSSGTPTDGGTEGGAADPVFGTTTFKAGNPGLNANGAAPDHQGSVEGKNCFDGANCHSNNDKKWGFAGTVYSTQNGGATVKNAEVAVADPAGNMVSVYTDDNGNYWYEGPKPAANSRAGVRNAGGKMEMSGIIGGDTGGACQAAGCHGLATQKLYIAP